MALSSSFSNFTTPTIPWESLDVLHSYPSAQRMLDAGSFIFLHRQVNKIDELAKINILPQQQPVSPTPQQKALEESLTQADMNRQKHFMLIKIKKIEGQIQQLKDDIVVIFPCKHIVKRPLKNTKNCPECQTPITKALKIFLNIEKSIEPLSIPEQPSLAKLKELLEERTHILETICICPISLEPLKAPNVLEPCGHILDATSLFDILKRPKSQCPCCRKEIEATTRINLFQFE